MLKRYVSAIKVSPEMRLLNRVNVVDNPLLRTF